MSKLSTLILASSLVSLVALGGGCAEQKGRKKDDKKADKKDAKKTDKKDANKADKKSASGE